MNGCTRSRRTWLFLALMLTVMLVIFLFSQQSGEGSHLVSELLAKVVGVLFPHIHDGPGTSSASPLLWGLSLRNWAHIGLYALLGVTAGLFYLSLYACRCPRAYLFAGTLSLLTGIAYAASDELHQYFVPGRSCTLRDVGLDTIGVLAGVGVTVLAWWGISHLHESRRRTDKS